MRMIIFVTTIVFILICAAINGVTRQIICDIADEHTEITALRLQAELEADYDKVQNYCMSLNEEEAIIGILGSDYAGISQYVSDAESILTSYKILETSIVDMAMVNDRIHYSGIFTDETMDTVRNTMGEATFQWIGMMDREFIPDEDKAAVLAFAGTVFSDGENLGTVIISIDADTLQIEDEEAMNSSYFLADGEGVLSPLNGSYEDAEAVYQIWTDQNQSGNFRKGSYYIHSYYISEMDTYLLAVLNTENVGQGMTKLQMLIWSCVLLVILSGVFLVWNVANGMVQPLQKFSDTMQKIRHGHQRRLDQKLELEGCQEIREIGNEFTSMMTDIDSLNRRIFQSATDLYEVKVQKQSAELAYLRSQIDPHFLYNTLEAMRQMALANNVPELAQMTLDMADIFRYSTKGSYEVSLQTEIDNTKAYIRIQQMRFQRKLEVFYFFPEEVVHLRVIKMLLQPIVENAIFHGLEPKEEDGCLYLGAHREGDRLLITIKDDGVGMSEEKLEEIRSSLGKEITTSENHVGILNTNARIHLQYGNEYGLSLESAKGDGTTVTITLPVIEGTEEAVKDIGKEAGNTAAIQDNFKEG
ncbi:MAG: sensor histidine kinase [Clostridiales bacterium]|nr:sensor histidine kinase [Clostridiales bacterium]MCC8106033.1 sensor histidine kinase [Clostridiales bacterium]